MDRFDLARRFHVADADIRAVDWVNGECFATLVDGTIRHLTDTGFEVVGAVPTPAELDPTPAGNVQTVIEWVAGDPARARQALDEELLRDRPRKGLTAYLERVVV